MTQNRRLFRLLSLNKIDIVYLGYRTREHISSQISLLVLPPNTERVIPNF